MPYFLYRVRPSAPFEKLAEFASFKDASAQAKALRLAQAESVPGKVKIMFAEHEQQAQELLSQVRTAGPLGDD